MMDLVWYGMVWYGRAFGQCTSIERVGCERLTYWCRKERKGRQDVFEVGSWLLAWFV